MHYVYILRSASDDRPLFWLFSQSSKKDCAAQQQHEFRDFIPRTMDVDLLRSLLGADGCAWTGEISEKWRRQATFASSVKELSREASNSPEGKGVSAASLNAKRLDHTRHVSAAERAFTWIIYTHVLNKPGLAIRSSLDEGQPLRPQQPIPS
jgi:hypothetical protein